MIFETINFEINNRVATLTMNRPEEANALNAKMAEELFELSVQCSQNKNLGAIIITANGKMFNAGGDLKEFNNPPGGRKDEHLGRVAANLHNALIRFAYMDAPVIMAINGTAAGGGFSLALSGDFILASEKAKFVSAYTASGLTPDGSSTYYLAKHVGLLKAKELFLTNKMLSAIEAKEWGIVNEVTKAENLLDRAKELATQFAAGPTKAFGGVKRMLLSSFSAPIESQLDSETRHIVGTMDTHDGPHGLNAFLNKEKPSFKGK
jgi:2-(1,2-epoxy-1,2-dihydrophenyl)acetyl-CoA isomerase